MLLLLGLLVLEGRRWLAGREYRLLALEWNADIFGLIVLIFACWTG